MTAVRTTCPYCGVGCGVTVTDGVFKGDTVHPANFGRLCSKGAALKDTVGEEKRLVSPAIEGREAGWEETLDLIASRFKSVIAEHGPEAVAFYVSGQFLTEDYYVANKLMKGFFGAANIDTNSRLCMSSSVAAMSVPSAKMSCRAATRIWKKPIWPSWSAATWPGATRFFISVSSLAKERRGTKIVVIDPRRTSTCETADLHLPLAAGGDVLLFNGLLSHLYATGTLDKDWMAQNVTGFEETLNAAALSAPSIEFVASATGVAPKDLLAFYQLFASTERVMTLYSQGVNQSVSGTDKVNAIINCHFATGRIGRAGMGPFSLTGQPNAMGGREVGGLANQLAAHMAFPPEDVDCVRRFWNAPGIATKPGLKAVDLFEAVGSGKVKAIWIAATNPAVSMPRANHIRDALKRCPFVVVSDAWPTDTSALANVVLPAAAWAEKDGTVTNSGTPDFPPEGLSGRPRRGPPGLVDVRRSRSSHGLGKGVLLSQSGEHLPRTCALSAFENDGRRVFDIGALADCDDAAYDALEPTQWPTPKRGRPHGPRLFARGGFSTPDGRGRMVPVIGRAEEKEEGEFTLKLNTGRVRDQWHTMTRTGRVPHLMTHVAAPQLAIHPRDAEVRGLVTDALARVESAHGESVLRVLVTDQQRPGEVFVPMHWTDEFSSASAIDRLVHDKTDPVSGQPDLKGGWVRVDAIDTLWNGTLLRRVDDVPDLGADVYWSKAPIKSGFAFDLAGWTPLSTVINSELALRRLLQIPADAELVSYSDPKKSVYRYAGLVGGELQACLFLAPAGAALPAREAAMAFLGRAIEPAERLSLLAAAVPDQAATADKMFAPASRLARMPLSGRSVTRICKQPRRSVRS